MSKFTQLNTQDIARFWSHINKEGALWTDPDTGETSHCWEWTAACNPAGYGIFGVKRLPFKATYLASRLSWFLKNGEIPKGFLACHKCDNPPCCNPDHLFLGTDAENKKDSVRKHRTCSGDRHRSKTHPHTVKYGEAANNVKLTKPQMLEIRYSTDTMRACAKRFGVSETTVFQIRRYKTWTKD